MLPRKHHYVPKCLLSGFTIGPDSATLHVLNKETGRSYPSNLRDAACERDFYIIEVEDDSDPYTIEKFFGGIESEGSEALRYLIEHRTIPSGDLYNKFIRFLALMSVRGPAVLEAFGKPTSQVLKAVLWYATRTKKEFAQFMDNPDVDGKHIVDDMTYEQAKKLVDSDEFTISLGQNYRMSTLFTMMQTVQPLLAARNWSVVVAGNCAPDFVCSDRPMTLCWTLPTQGPIGPAFGMMNTTAMFPLSRRLALLGLFEKINVPSELNVKAVGSFNMFAAIHAKKYVYSGTDEFTVLLADGTITGRAGFLKAIKRPVAANSVG